MVLVEMQGDGFPRAAIAVDMLPDSWLVLRFTACAGPTFLPPAANVPADDRKRHASFSAAYRLALRKEIPPLERWARA